ncbi:MAG: hypothetical protein P4L31_00220 [Candidatus Babeliales bacterium]|nr:hypothetical protein [Candidatus Babeliales bacterium]
MFTMFDKLSERNKGLVLVVSGAVLLLSRFGFMHEVLHTVIIIGGIYLIALGLFKLQVHKKVMELINKKS